MKGYWKHRKIRGRRGYLVPFRTGAHDLDKLVIEGSGLSWYRRRSKKLRIHGDIAFESHPEDSTNWPEDNFSC